MNIAKKLSKLLNQDSNYKYINLSDKCIIFLYNKKKQNWVFNNNINIKKIIYKNETYHITFNNEKTYTFHIDNVYIISNYSSIDASNSEFIDKNNTNNPIITNIKSAIYWNDMIALIKKDLTVILTKKSNITIREVSTKKKVAINLLNYLKDIEQKVANSESKEKSFLYNSLNHIDIFNNNSFLNEFLTTDIIRKNDHKNPIIFPFGSNESQVHAVKNALNNNLSVIYGPPGTGKTQTILNIIANLICSNKTIAIVSSNNGATKNVKDKLDKLDILNIGAFLGNKNNVEQFFKDIKKNNIYLKKVYDKKLDISIKDVDMIIDKINSYIKTSCEIKNKINAIKIEEKEQLDIFLNFDNNKIKFFKKYLEKLKNISSEWILNILHYSDLLFLKNNVKIKNKIKSFFKLIKIFKFNFILFFNFKNHIISIQEYIKYKYYSIYSNELFYKENEIKNELFSYIPKNILSKYNNDISSIQSFITDIFLDIFKNYVIKNYSNFNNNFSLDNYRNEFHNFIKRYPIVYSTTHSLMSCTNGYIFDYVIFDEASQIDLSSAIVALSCAKNVVIVGDLMQIEHVVDYNHHKEIDELFNSYDIPEYYNYKNNSLLKCVNKKYDKNLVSQLLNEHYRCPPSIIGFSNTMFYNSQLIIHTQDNDSSGVTIHITSGYDEYNRQNLFQVEMIKNIVEDNKINDYVVISQYKNQIDAIRKELPNNVDNIDTIHKFQGRENDTVFFSTVKDSIIKSSKDDASINFLNNENLINVAFSRAKKQLHLIVSRNLLENDCLIKDFVRYINHYHPESISTKEYKNNNPSILEILNEHYEEFLKIKGFVVDSDKMEHKTEILAKKWIQDVIDTHFVNKYSLQHNIPLYNIVNIKKFENVIDDKKFIINNWTKCDFVIYSKIDKKVDLVIEIDGRQHQNDKQKNRDIRKDRILNESKIKVCRLPVVYSEQLIKDMVKHELNNVNN